MNSLKKLVNNVAQQVTGDSASWGALGILACGLGVLLMLMIAFSYS